jgi:fumarate reductase flavoprotein subunit
MGVKPEVLKDTVEEYNSFCDHGRDAGFAKNPIFLMPLRNPPYYALKGGLALTATHGGVKINQRMEALDKEDEPIGGLYAAGVETGATDWDSYNMWLSGHSFGFAINSGRIAGEEAAKYAGNQ